MSGQRKVVRKTRARHGRDDHICAGLPSSAATSGSTFKPCGHSLNNSNLAYGPAVDGKPLDLTQLTPEQRQKLESFLKSSGFGPLPTSNKTLDAATMRKLAQHMRTQASMPGKAPVRNLGDTTAEKNPKDGLVRQAVSSSKRDDVKNLLEEGGDVDETEPKTLCTPLMLAVRDGSKEIVQLLLDYDADVNRRDKDGKTAIMEACAGGRDDLVQLLIDHGSLVSDVDNNNWNSLTHAAAKGHVRCAQVVMRHLKYDRDSQEKLREVIKKEEKKHMLAAAGMKKQINPKDKNAKTFQQTTDLDDYDESDCAAESALAVAAQNGQYDFVKWYLSHKEQFKVTEAEIQIACSKACQSKRIDLLRLLIEEHGAKVNPDPPVNETPLCAAAASGDIELVKYLLANGADVNQPDGAGVTPLMRACSGGNTNLVPVFLQHGALVDAQNAHDDNSTSLCYAVAQNHLPVIQQLIAAHAKVNLGGTPPLLRAVSLNNVEAVEYLLSHGASPTQKTSHGDSALINAAEVGKLDWVKRFHALGCEIDCPGDKGITALMKAAKKGALDIVEYLLDNGASINRTSTNNEFTALSLACSKGNEKVIELLLERGANRHARLKDNVTPLLEAVRSGKEAAANLVLYHQPKSLLLAQQPVQAGQEGGLFAQMPTRGKEGFPLPTPCANCDSIHCSGAMVDVSSDEDDDVDEEGDDDDDQHYCGEDEEAIEETEDEEGNEDDEEDYTSEDEGDEDDEKADSMIADLPEIFPGDLADLDCPSPDTDYNDMKEGLDADIDFIRTQLAHFQPQSFEFRILNAMLRKAEQLQKSLPDHTPEELRRRFSEEINRWQHELQSNTNVDDLMNKLIPEASGQRGEELIKPTLEEIAQFFGTNQVGAEFQQVFVDRQDFTTESLQGVDPEKANVSLSADGKYIIMTNTTGSYSGPLDWDLLAKMAGTGEDSLHVTGFQSSSGTISGTVKALNLPGLPEEIAKAMMASKQNGIFDLNALSAYFHSAGKEDPQLMEQLRNMTRIPASFNFAAQPPASLSPQRPTEKPRKLSEKKAASLPEPSLEPRRPKKMRNSVFICDSACLSPSVVEGRSPNAFAAACGRCYNCGRASAAAGSQQAQSAEPNLTHARKEKAPRTPEPSPDDSSEGGSDDTQLLVNNEPLPQPPPLFKPTVGRSAKKTVVKNTRDAATNVAQPAPPPKKPALVDVDQMQDSDSSTPIIQAAIRGNANMIRMLCDAGAKPNHKDKKGWTALGYAVERGHKDAVKELCDHGAELDLVMDTNQAKRDTALTIACYNGRAEIVRILLDYKANIEHRNSNDYTPLCVACLNGHARVAQMLIQRGADINARGTKLGISPLMLAAMNGHTNIVKLLIDNQADVNQFIETNRNTALTLACFQGRTECVRVLVDKDANLEWRSKNGLNAMMEAANGGFYEIGKILIEAGAEVNCAPVPSTRDTPLTIAAEKGHAKFVQLLIENGASVNVRNKKGATPLWLACQNGHLDCVKALVTYGQADVDARDNRQMSCILVAFKRGHENIVKLLVDHIQCYPSEEEMVRYCKDVKVNGSNSYLLATYERCKKAILDAKHKKEAEADAKAASLLQELDLQQKAKEGQRAKKRDKKKQKKKSTVGKSEEATNSNAGSPAPSRSASPEPIPVKQPTEKPRSPVVEDFGAMEEVASKKKKRRKNGVKENMPVEVANGKSGAGGDVPVKEAAQVEGSKTAQMANKPEVNKTKTELVVPSAPGGKRPNTAPAQVAPPTSRNASDLESPDAEQADEEWVQQKPRSQKGSSKDKDSGSQDRRMGSARLSAPIAPDAQKLLNAAQADGGWREVVGRSKKFKVPTSAIARIIGKGGVNINAIRANTGAHIEIEKNKPGVNDRLITVKGTGDSVTDACHLIHLLVENVDKNIEELIADIKPALKEKEVGKGDYARVVVSEMKPVMSKPAGPPKDGHSTQVFTNSQIHQGKPLSTANRPAAPVGSDNYSAIVSQKRPSLHTITNTVQSAVVNGDAPISHQHPRSTTLHGESGKDIANNAQASEQTSARNTTAGGQKFKPIPVPNQPAPVVVANKSPTPRLPVTTTSSSTASATTGAVRTSNKSPLQSSTQPGKSAESHPVFGGLLSALVKERERWNPDVNDFFGSDSSSSTNSSSLAAPSLSNTGFSLASSKEPLTLFGNYNPMDLLGTPGGYGYDEPPDRPSSLPGIRTNYAAQNGFLTPTSVPTPLDSFGMTNGFTEPAYDQPLESSWGYDQDPTSKFMSLAASMAKFAAPFSSSSDTYGGRGYGGSLYDQPSGMHPMESNPRPMGSRLIQKTGSFQPDMHSPSVPRSAPFFDANTAPPLGSVYESWGEPSSVYQHHSTFPSTSMSNFGNVNSLPLSSRNGARMSGMDGDSDASKTGTVSSGFPRDRPGFQ